MPRRPRVASPTAETGPGRGGDCSQRSHRPSGRPPWGHSHIPPPGPRAGRWGSRALGHGRGVPQQQMLGIQPAKPRGFPRPLAGLPVHLGSPVHSAPGPSPQAASLPQLGPCSQAPPHRVGQCCSERGQGARNSRGRGHASGGGGHTLRGLPHTAPRPPGPTRAPLSPHSPVLARGDQVWASAPSRVGAASPQSPRLRHLGAVPIHSGVSAAVQRASGSPLSQTLPNAETPLRGLRFTPFTKKPSHKVACQGQTDQHQRQRSTVLEAPL